MKKIRKTAEHHKADLAAKRWEEAALKLSALCTEYKMLLATAKQRHRADHSAVIASFEREIVKFDIDRLALEGTIEALKRRLFAVAFPPRPATDDGCRA